LFVIKIQNQINIFVPLLKRFQRDAARC